MLGRQQHLVLENNLRNSINQQQETNLDFSTENVCDLATMTISDEEFERRPNNLQFMPFNQLNMTIGENLDDENMALTPLDCGEALSVENLPPIYLDDVELDEKEEEQTVTELVKANSTNNGQLIDASQSSHMRIAFGIILRLVLPLANGVARGIKGIRDVRFLRFLRGITSSRQILTSLVAYAANTLSMNLSSVQVSHRIDPILRLMKIRKARDGVESLPDLVQSSIPNTPETPNTSFTPFAAASSSLPAALTPTTIQSPFFREPKSLTGLPAFSPGKRKSSAPEQAAPKCCTLNVLAEPPPGQPIRADIILIHGLHGSLVNTWKQGLWENERQPVEFDRPPKPPVRPPKRPRYTRTAHIKPPRQKRARFAHKDVLKQGSSETEQHDDIEESADGGGAADFSYICGKAEDIRICDGIEYSFPALRLRVNDNGRLMQAQIASILNEQNDEDQSSNKSANSDRNQPKPKLTPNDPNYSKCWPGDWLPLDCPGVRVIAVNYTTDQYLWRPLWKKKEPRTNLIQRAREMTELLIQQRVGYGHPIVWVGHSKGGLFIKQIIVDAWESGRPAAAPFWRSARGCFFYSVPHRGSHLASIKAPLLTRSVELLDIEKNSKYLLDLHRRFVGLYHLGHLKIEVFSFVETALTLMSVLYLRIVGVDSADPGIGDVCGIRLDHREICKPRSRDCILYKELVKMIKKVS